eukprot:scaffold1943_cov65-Phaeocystis_antarctica.AAC.3
MSWAPPASSAVMCALSSRSLSRSGSTVRGEVSTPPALRSGRRVGVSTSGVGTVLAVGLPNPASSTCSWRRSCSVVRRKRSRLARSPATSASIAGSSIETSASSNHQT